MTSPDEQAKQHVARGKAALDIGRHEAAEREAREALAVAPQHYEALVLLTRALIVQGRYNDAVAGAARAIEANPTDAYGHYLRGMIHELQKQYAEAEVHLREACKLDTRDSVYRARLAMALAGKGDADEAEKLVGEALALGPTFWLTLDLSFLALMRAQRVTRAIEVGEKLREASPDKPEPHRRLAWAFNVAKRYDEADASARRAIAVQPNDADAWFELGYSGAMRGKRSEALAAYRESVRIRPSQVAVHENIVKILREEGDFSAAETAVVKAIAACPNAKTLVTLRDEVRAAIVAKQREVVEQAARESRETLARTAETPGETRKSDSEKSDPATSPGVPATALQDEEIRTALERAAEMRRDADARLASERASRERARKEVPPPDSLRKSEEGALATRADQALALWFMLALALVSALLFWRGC
ncbi:MAG: tetratricopeptide repeat protein [Deltaproteobacteria bacterium]|nr:tetratricopeptide repeat protein [Deltaproteobacteria bacterium]